MPSTLALVPTRLRPPMARAVLTAAWLVMAGVAGARAQEPSIHLEGYLQTDARFYPGSQPDAPPATYLIRRARVVVEGTVARYVTFVAVPDFSHGSASLAEATVGVRLADGLAIRAGQTKPRVGLESTQKSADLHFMERGLTAYLLPARDLGIDVGGDLLGRTVRYDVGLFNGVPDYGTSTEDTGDGKDLAGRVFVTPFARRGDRAPIDLGVGLGASTGTESGGPELPLTSSLRSPGQATFFTYRTEAGDAVIAEGRRSRLDPQAYLYRGPFGLWFEYAESRHHVRRGESRGSFRHRAWQVAGTLLLTGEHAGFGILTPKHDLEPERGFWGAVEVAARLEGADADPDAFPLFADPALSARRARGVGLGVSWYLARRTKLVFEYEHTTFRGGAPDGDRAAENFVAARLQVSR